jgi:phosphoglycolate phosphatase-like HAD superfamily hydrolase
MSVSPIAVSASASSSFAPDAILPTAVLPGHGLAIPTTAPLPLPKVLLCDLDGTLIDSMPTLADLATEVMERLYGTPRMLARELYLATCGLPFIKQLEEIYPGDARNPVASDLFEGRKPARCGAIRMPAETRRALERMRARGVRLAVSSNNGTENVEAFARGADFAFDLVLGFGGGLAKGRPHLDRASSVFGVGRQEMLFVGDSLHDGEIAEKEGVPFVGIAGTFSADRFTLRFPHLPVVRRFAALPDLF